MYLLIYFFFPQHNLGGGEAPAEGEEQDGDEEAGHRFLGLRRLRRSSAQSKEPPTPTRARVFRLLAARPNFFDKYQKK